MFKFLLGLALSIGLLCFNTAWAYSFISCDFDPASELIPKPSLSTLISDSLKVAEEKYNCSKDEDGYEQCEYRSVWIIPNRVFSVSTNAKVTCVNFGDKAEEVSLSFNKFSGARYYSDVWKNLNLSISGAGVQKTFSNMEDMEEDTSFAWGKISIPPCKNDCWDMSVAWPRYTTNLTFTFSVRPKVFKLDASSNQSYPYYNLQDAVGSLWLITGTDAGVTWSTLFSPYLSICGLAGQTKCSFSGGGGGGGGGPIRPPIKQCTLTIVTPDVVAFQPISSDDLSRDRVRTEDFTLTVIKGPDQSTPCMGSAYNLPGEIKTQGGYSISSTFWGINHSSGAPQGIGLKLYDLGKGSYLRFNYQYPSFISDISSISETKRIRAEISATTKDLKKIKDGTYSQVLTFEVKMP